MRLSYIRSEMRNCWILICSGFSFQLSASAPHLMCSNCNVPLSGCYLHMIDAECSFHLDKKENRTRFGLLTHSLSPAIWRSGKKKQTNTTHWCRKQISSDFLQLMEYQTSSARICVNKIIIIRIHLQSAIFCSRCWWGLSSFDFGARIIISYAIYFLYTFDFRVWLPMNTWMQNMHMTWDESGA